jgi:hypothetical protein
MAFGGMQQWPLNIASAALQLKWLVVPSNTRSLKSRLQLADSATILGWGFLSDSCVIFQKFSYKMNHFHEN